MKKFGATVLLHHSAFILLPSGKREKWFWQGCKPNSVCTLAGGENHLSKRPIPETCPLSRARSGQLLGFQFGLAPDGVFRAVSLALHAVRSYRTFSPLPPACARRRFNFLWHCPSASLPTDRLRVSRPNKPGLRSIAPYGVRTFLYRRTGSDSPPCQNQF